MTSEAPHNRTTAFIGSTGNGRCLAPSSRSTATIHAGNRRVAGRRRPTCVGGGSR
jgi:hypothetical protein